MVKAAFAHFEQLFERECRHIAALFKAMLDKDSDAFRTELAVIHPGDLHRMVCLVLLSKLAFKIGFEPADFGYDLMKYEQIAKHLTPQEWASLWERFVALDKRLKSDTEQFVPGFQSGPMSYCFEEMPANFDVEDFIASWDA